MDDLVHAVDALATRTGFSGVVRVDHGDSVVLEKAYGLAHRAYGSANTVDTQFGTASATKGFTALTIVALVAAGRLALDTTVRSVLGADLPSIAGDVTVEHLLAHRSGIGDYFDEDLERPIDEYALSVSAHELATTEDYLRVLDGFRPKFAAGTAFSYCNSGYVVLALIAERVAGTSFPELVERHVCAPAGLRDTAFLRSDELPARAAIGYLYDESDRTNVFHLPVRGSGDGGIASTAADVHALWAAMFAGRIVSPEWVGEMTRPRSNVPSDDMRYGLGFWLHATRDVAVLTGYDAGVSFRSAHDLGGAFTHTVISNTSEGAWPLARFLDDWHSPR